MEFERFAQIVPIIAEYFNREVEVVNRYKPDGNILPGLFARFNSSKKEYSIAHCKCPGKSMFDENNRKSLYIRNGRFIENVGYELTDDILFVMGILHEFGHFEYADTMHTYNLSKARKFLSRFSKDYMGSTVTAEDYNAAVRNGVALRYMISGEEMFCDSFAKDYFVPVMKLLKEKGLME